MALNLLIGVGGTGAKVVEAALVAFLAGLGPPSVTVGFVDQDESNGNVDRARDLLARSAAFRRLWSGERPDALDFGAPEEGGLPFGRVVVDALDPPLWCPHAEQGTTLASIFSADVMSRDDEALRSAMDVLYAPGPEELGMDLGVGYRGRPHVGAAAMLSRLADPDNGFARALTAALRRARSGEEVRIFLCGSVFGGTGAAGFPNLARTLRKLADDARGGGGGQVRVGGALMLPYFSFAPPEDEGANVAKPEDLLRNTRDALKYYHRLFSDEAVFDELYLTGWSPAFPLGYHSPGAASQANPPLPPELVAAMGAVRFFDGARSVGGEGANAVFISSRDQRGALSWGDVPAVTRERRGEPGEAFGRLLRFCAAWRDTYRPELGRKKGVFGGRPQWWSRQELRGVRLDRAETQENLEALDRLVERVLVWAATLQQMSVTPAFGDPPLSRFELWDLSRMVGAFAPAVDAARRTPQLSLRPPEGATPAEDFDRVVRPQDGRAPPGQRVLNEDINNRRAAGRSQGLGVLVAAVHQGADVRPRTAA